MEQMTSDTHKQENGAQKCAERIGTDSVGRICEYCGQRFMPTRKWQKFCCEEHRKAAWRKGGSLAVLQHRIESLENENIVLTRQVNELYKHLGIMDYK